MIKVVLSAVAGLVWCVLVVFFCMCVEHLLFKKTRRPALTDKEVILIKEVLAGHICLPQVANDGLFVQCVDRIEQVFEQFIAKNGRQAGRLEELSERLSAMYMENKKNEVQTHTFPLIEADDAGLELEQEEVFSQGLSFEEILRGRDSEKKGKEREKEKKEKESLLNASIDSTGLPPYSRGIFRYSMSCATVNDILQVMVCFGSRKSLLKIRGIGDVSVDRLEAFMLDNGLMYMRNHMYQSEYEDPEALAVLRENKKFPRIR
ncbi:hypothetical protein [Dysgonomonas macrotermitis]|uniref:hypothetical protein n=1 Tax=Dysgonomonas macrotermitis TaxID=1346286 RepID=UPI00160A3588|nr:hypothetical protein [Dysgonomonas macrotermitis]